MLASRACADSALERVAEAGARLLQQGQLLHRGAPLRLQRLGQPGAVRAGVGQVLLQGPMLRRQIFQLLEAPSPPG